MTPHQTLKQYWGFDDFRPLQLDIIQSVMEGNDTLALLPTGGGKSLCFQVPALCMDGICIVVSPLIALMKDQVHNLIKRGIKAHAIYSGMTHQDIDRVLDNCVHGQVQFLYLSPERLTSELALERIKLMNIALIAIDEAHCISQWGYDFRPSYLSIAEIREFLPKVPLIALTATATAPVVKDIQEKLAFKKQSKVFQKSFARDNLSYVVLYEDNKRNKMLEILKKIQGSGVVYVQNRKETKDVAYFLYKNGISADYYHAGRSGEIREKVQDNWIKNQVRIIVATNAFGMGIDKPDVRVVIHLTLPDSLEAYFQEAGRGGRDGQKAYGILLYNQSDRIQHEKHFKQAFPTIEEIRRVYQALGSYFQLAVGSGLGQTLDFDLVDFAKTYNFNPLEALNSLKILKMEEYLDLTESIFLPSTLQVIINKEALYDYRLRNSTLDPLLSIIFRSAQGVFTHDVNIQETELARSLKIQKKELVEMLFKLHKDQIIRYKPQKDAPQLTFLTERIAHENLTIDQVRYRFLKERQEQRMTKTISYAETLQCRSQMLLAYFDENGAKACGQCDVCMGRHDNYVQHNEYYTIKNRIEYLLKQSTLDLRTLVDEFPSNQKEKILQTIQHLLDNKILDRGNDDKLYWLI